MPAKEVAESEYTKEYYLWVNDGHQEFRESGGSKLPKRLQDAVDLAQLKSGQKVLDVGCGRGEIIMHAAKQGCEAYGVDYSVAAIDIATEAIKKNKSTAKVIKISSEKMPFEGSFFDTAFLTDVVEHLTPEQLRSTLAEIYKALKAGGKLIITTSPNNLLSKPLYTASKLVGIKRGNVNEKVHINEQNYFKLNKMLRRVGFSTKFSFSLDVHWFKNTHAYAKHKKFMRPITNLIENKTTQAIIANTPLKIFLSTEITCVAKK